MAEFGDLFNTNNDVDNIKVEIEMLDYGYVQECNDCNKLQSILKVLKSGKEGHYPDLIRVTEEKMVSLLHPKDKKKYLALRHKTSPNEIAEATADLTNWQASVVIKDETITKNAKILKETKKIIPVRGNNNVNNYSNKGDLEMKGTSNTEPSILLNPVENIILSESENQQEILKILSFLNVSQKKKIEKLRKDLNVAELNKVKRQYKSNLEKIKGNESFRVADNNDAVLCYSRSIAYDIQNPLVWANRAMAYIRLELFDLAEADSSIAIHLDPNYTKAYSRRGLVRFKRGKYTDAVDDFKTALIYDPHNKELQTLLLNAKDKYFEVEGTTYIDNNNININTDEVNSSSSSSSIVAVQVSNESEDGTTMLINYVDKIGDLLLPNLLYGGSTLLYEGTLQAVVDVVSEEAKPPSGFVRINVIADDDSDSDSMEDSDNSNNLNKHPSLESSSTNTNNTSNTTTASIAAAVTQSVSRQDDLIIPSTETNNNNNNSNNNYQRVVISEEDSESESESDDHHVANGEETEQHTLQMKEAQVVTLKEQGNKLMGENKIYEAIEIYSLSLDILPNYLPSLNNRAQAYLMIKDYDGVIRDSSKVLNIEPTNVKALYRRASAFLSKGMMDGSKEDVDLILSIDPNNKQTLKLIEILKLSMVDTMLPPPPPPVSVSIPVVTLESSNTNNTTTSNNIAPPVPPVSSQSEHTPLTPPPIPSIPVPLEDITTNSNINSNIASNTTPNINSNITSNTNTTNPLSSKSSSIRSESDYQKELGNKAMADKTYLTAITYYNNAIKIDESNIAAYNNRCLAYLKLKEYVLAEIDATTVIHTTTTTNTTNTMGSNDSNTNAMGSNDSNTNAMGSNDSNTTAITSQREVEDVENHMFIVRKALTRRSQARRAIADDYYNNYISTTTSNSSNNNMSKPSSLVQDKKKYLLLAQDKYRESQSDLNIIIRTEPNNKNALTELKYIKASLKKCQEALTPITTITKQPSSPSSNNNTTSTNNSINNTSINSTTTAPRANMKHISQLLSHNTSTSNTSNSFDSIGMVARSVKKFNSDGTTTNVIASSDTTNTTTINKASNITNNNTTVVKETKSNINEVTKVSPKKSLDSNSTTSPASVIPTELPKTVYEFERVWRGLKDQPDNFATYISNFKKITFKKVFKDSTSPDLISYMWLCMKQCVSNNSSVQLKVLLGFSLITNFSLTLSLLPANDIQVIQDIFDNIYKDKTQDMNSFIELAKVYNIHKY